MGEVKVSKLEIAGEYLDAAIEFFVGQSNYFSAIHLAAAAEELFGAYLCEEKTIFTSAWKAEKALRAELVPVPLDADAHKKLNKKAQDYLNKWKNELKHMDRRTVPTIKIDPSVEAEYQIEHALINFNKLNLQKSAAVWKFEDYQNLKKAGIA